MARRSAGTGSVLPYRGKRWRATFSKRVAGERVRGTKVFHRRIDAEEWLREQIGAPTAAPGTLAEWIAEWRPIHESKTAKQTHDRDFQAIKTHIFDRIGEVRLRELSALRVEKFLADLSRDGISSSERKRAATTLRKVLSAAVRADRIPINPFEKVTIPKHRTAEVRPMTAEQAGHFCWVAGGWDELYDFGFRLWIDGAMRPGEWLGLQWTDLDEATATVKIQRSLEIKTHTLREPKTPKSRRIIPMSETTVAALRRMGVSGKTGPMFPDTLGGHMRLSNFSKWIFRPAAADAGVEWATPYTLRHTAASLLLSAGCSIPTVSARLGHEKSSQTLDTYAHIMPNDQSKATAALSGLLKPPVTHGSHDSP